MLSPMLEIGLAVILIGQPQAAANGHFAERSMPAPLWRGVSRIVLVCAGEMDIALCDAIHKAAKIYSPWPVALSAPISANRDTIILTIAVEQSGSCRRLVGVAQRAVEIDEAEAPARRAVGWPADTLPSAAVDTLVAGILPRRSGG